MIRRRRLPDAPGLKLQLMADTLGSVSVGSPVTHHRHRRREGRGVSLARGRRGARDRRVHRAGACAARARGQPLLERERHRHLVWNGRHPIHGDVAGSRCSRAESSSTRPQDDAVTPVAHGGAVYHPVFRPGRPAATFFKQTSEAVLYFKDSLRGLAPGAPVEFRGIRLGTVKRFGAREQVARIKLSRAWSSTSSRNASAGRYEPGESAKDLIARLIAGRPSRAPRGQQSPDRRAVRRDRVRSRRASHAARRRWGTRAPHRGVPPAQAPRRDPPTRFPR